MRRLMAISNPYKAALSGEWYNRYCIERWLNIHSEAIEDLTGGVTTELFTTDILDQDRFWTDELRKVNDDFLFGCATGFFSNWLYPDYNGPRERRGIAEMHAYSIMEAREEKGERLLRLRYVNVDRYVDSNADPVT